MSLAPAGLSLGHLSACPPFSDWLTCMISAHARILHDISLGKEGDIANIDT